MTDDKINFKIEKGNDGRSFIWLSGEDILSLLGPDALDLVLQHIDESDKTEEDCLETMELNSTFHYQIFVELPAGK